MILYLRFMLMMTMGPYRLYAEVEVWLLGY